jgi:hypothetical protein
MRAVARGILLACGLLLSSCDQLTSNRFELAKDTQGRTIRLDRKTGEVALIDSERIVNVKTAKEVEEQEKAEATILAMPKDWRNVSYPALGGVTGTLKTSWRDGQMLYQFTIAPISEQLAAPPSQGVLGFVPTLIVLLYDPNGFKVGEINLPLNQMTRGVDDKGKPQALSADGSIAISKSNYRSAAFWILNWRL